MEQRLDGGGHEVQVGTALERGREVFNLLCCG